MPRELTVDSEIEKKLRAELEPRTDIEAMRLKRFLAMADLSRTEGSPLFEVMKRIMAMPEFADFDVVKVPEIVPARESFDLFNFPPDHPARSRSDTYYVNDEYILRTHTTIMWWYYLLLPEIKAKILAGAPIGVLSYGKIYRRDEIDRRHMNMFHQVDGLYLVKRSDAELGLTELQNILTKIAQTIYGKDIEYRFNKDTFPYTDPSLEMEIKMGDAWVEVLGSGVVQDGVLANLGVDPKVYNGWAFGFGLERLAILSMDLPDIRLLWSQDERVKKQLVLGNKYKEVSKYPSIVRDISFVVPVSFAPNDYFDLIRDIGGDLVEQVELLDKYENAEKFGEGKVSYTYRIVYRSTERTLTVEEIAPLQEKITEETKKQFGAEVR
jgi:phenylalanyl-tRNA synthetase alpha chain